MVEATDSVLLGLIATLIGALVFALKTTMRRSDEDRKASLELQKSALAELKRAVDTNSAMNARVLAELQSLTSTQERILKIQERILSQLQDDAQIRRPNGT